MSFENKKAKDNGDKNTHLPLISIITVTFNADKTLEQTILSVVNQNYSKIEYIIIDGNSIDGTTEIIKKYENKIAFWVSEPDSGIYDAMNKGVDRVKGKWVYFLGSGDILLDNLGKVAANLTDEQCIYYGNVYRNDIGGIYNGKYHAFKLAVTNISHQAIFYPASALRKYKYNTKYRMLADHDLNMRCYGDKNYKFKYLPILISNYEGNGYSELNPDFDFYKDKLKLIKQNFPFIVYMYASLRTAVAKLVKGGIKNNRMVF